MCNKKFILIDTLPVEIDDLIFWAKEFNNNTKRIVKKTNIGNILISTVFLGICHEFLDDHKHCILFETLVFDDKKECPEYEGHMIRYTTYQKALKGHNELVKEVKTFLKQKN
jgi:hypothetical protein